MDTLPAHWWIKRFLIALGCVCALVWNNNATVAKWVATTKHKVPIFNRTSSRHSPKNGTKLTHIKNTGKVEKTTAANSIQQGKHVKGKDRIDGEHDSKKAQHNRPNLIFILTDQQRFDAMSIAGNTVLHTPNMDRIAREGAYFASTYSASPVCGPARTSLLTGLTIEHTEVRTNGAVGHANMTTYDGYLVQQEGYMAEYHGKWHSPQYLGDVYQNSEESIYADHMSAPYQSYLDSVGMHRMNYKMTPPGTVLESFSRQPYIPNPLDSRFGREDDDIPLRGTRQPDQHGVSTIPAEHTLTAFNARETLLALNRLAREQTKNSRPFSLHCSFSKPHAPHTPSEPFASMFDPSKMPIPLSINDTMPRSPYKHSRRLLESDPSLVGYMISNYYANIKEVDVWLGRILNRIDRLGLTNNTLLVFSSDHGEMLGSHGMREKNVFYEESVRIPLLLRFPGVIPAGTVVNEHVSHRDVFPTLLDYLGAKEQSSDGNSLRRLVDKQTQHKRSPVAKEEANYTVSEWNYHGPGAQPGLMIRYDNWKFFIPTTVESRVVNVLYDLDSDPQERINLIHANHRGRDDYMDIASKLRTLLVEWCISVGSPFVEGVRDRQL